ncbi:MAG: cytochrome C assembly family protein [Anaerolineales bacterium]
MSDRQLFQIAVVLYGLSTLYALFVLRAGFRKDTSINYSLLLGGAAFHTWAMFERGFSLQRCPISNLYEATTFIAWTIVAAYLLIGAWGRLRFLGAFVSPLLLGLGVFALFPALDVRAATPTFTGGWSSLHNALILLAFGAFGLCAVAGLMYVTQDRDLKLHKLRAALSLLPPIQRLEAAIGRLLLAGFALLTAGLVVSVIYLKQTRDVYFSSDALVLYSLFVWALYLTLVVLRWGFAHRGRRLAMGAIGSFLFVALTFWGVYLLSGLHNPEPDHRPRTELRP